MQNQYLIQRLNHYFGHLVVLVHRIRKEHIQEVLGVAFLLVGLDQGKTLGRSVGNGSHSWELGNELDGHNFTTARVFDIQVTMEERRESTHDSAHDSHGVSTLLEPLIKLLDPLVNHHLVGDFLAEYLELTLAGEISIGQKEARFHKVALFGKLVD